MKTSLYPILRRCCFLRRCSLRSAFMPGRARRTRKTTCACCTGTFRTACGPGRATTTTSSWSGSKAYDPDVCVWCEAQSIYKIGHGRQDGCPPTAIWSANWGELAARYGHKYWYVGGHRDNFPQVDYVEIPDRERRANRRLEAPDSVVTHGAGWARIVKNGRPVNIVTLHTWPQAYAFRGRGPRRQPGRDTAATATAAWRSSISATHTIAYAVPDAGQQLWMMMGDFNSRSSPRQPGSTTIPTDDTRLLVHDYIRGAHALCRRDRTRSIPASSTPRRTGRVAHRFRLLHAAALRADHACRGGRRTTYTEPVRDPGKLSNFLPPFGPPSDSWWTSI